jgi:hypothetical protein
LKTINEPLYTIISVVITTFILVFLSFWSGSQPDIDSTSVLVGITIAGYVIAFLILYLLISFTKIEINGYNSDLGDPDPNFDEPIENQDVLALWYINQKKGLNGFFRSIPLIQDLNLNHEERSDLFESELDIEYYQVLQKSRTMPFSRAQSQQFYSEPIAVKFPEIFINKVDEYPIQGSLHQITCHNCSGAGQIRCSRCGGDGKVRCSSCNGRGRKRKRVRDGDDGWKTEWEDCTWCFNGRKRCNKCKGSGQIICITCSGEGLLGEFQIKEYTFIHKKYPKVKRYSRKEVYDSPIKDIPNRFAKTIDGLTLDDVYDQEKHPDLPEDVFSTLKLIVQEFDELSGEIENAIFRKISFRQMPQIELQLKINETSYTIIGRGFKPLNQSNLESQILPVKKVKLLGFFGLVSLGILISLFSYLFLFIP